MLNILDYSTSMKFRVFKMAAKMAAMLLAILAAGAYASPMVDALHGEAVMRNADLQAQVSEHASALDVLNTLHLEAAAARDAAQDAVAQAQAERDAAQAALNAANAQLTAEQAADDAVHLDNIATAVNDFYQTVVVHYLELIAEHGEDGAAMLIAERLGVDAAVVAPLLIAPMMPEPSFSREDHTGDAGIVEEAPEAPTEAETLAQEVPAESGDNEASDGEADPE